MKSLKAIYPPLTTPFKNDEVSYQDLKSNINRYNQFNLSGYVLGGSNGEVVFLTADEKLKLISTAREHAKAWTTYLTCPAGQQELEAPCM